MKFKEKKFMLNSVARKTKPSLNEKPSHIKKENY